MEQHVLEILEYNKIKERLAKHTSSKLARKLVNNLKPVNDFDFIQKRQLEVTSAKKILNREEKYPPLGGMKDVRDALKRASKEITLSGEELVEIANTLSTSRGLKKYLLNLEDEEDEYKSVVKYGVQLDNFKSLERSINNALDNQGNVLDSASTKLRNIRRSITDYSQRIKNELNSILSSKKYQNYIQDSLVTIRDKRYVIPIKSQFQDKVSGIVHDQSASKQTVFIEPMAVVKLNNKLRSFMAEEEEEIYRILTELTYEVREELDRIKETLKVLAWLDFTFAKAEYSFKIEGAEPVLNQEEYISLEKARHPLIPADEVVPIDIKLGGEFDTLVITGPNTGGKTVTLKTVGLLTLMAQSGLHIPALSGSKIAVFDEIYGDIGDEQSIEQNLSTFSSHMTRIIDILEIAKENTLVLLDEIGAGTDPTEGAALAMAILEELYSRDQINTIATTHYSQLKTFAYQQEGIENASVEFDVETLQPTYRLQMGMPGRSNAFEIASRLGLQEEVIEKARAKLSEEDIEVDKIIQNIEESKQSISKDEEAAKAERKKAEALKEEYEAKLAKVEKLEQKIKKEAYAEAEEIIAGAKKKVDKVVTKMKEQAEVNRQEVDRAKSKIDEYRHNLSNERIDLEEDIKQQELQQQGPANLEVGDKVQLKKLNKEGEIIELSDDKEEAVIQTGVMKVNVDISRLERIDDSDQQQKVSNNTNIGSLKGKKSRHISPKLDLRGLRAVEAKEKVDKYLDDAYLAGISKAEVVHGKGTGVLRNVVHELLEDHSQVDEYRLGDKDEGGSGVTIVKF
ncbi:endonuclease MutS2 [Sporohalobacter salinus]|uniref:endonuclease MutS2 n=1 Tax=Sporohalobacter salinus TaxID=1494606 RepID=UPI001961E3F9|nr:endonuclease MutS2 [Sporohalobacter salinus]MBM7624645.1 DNA mismatch repair protein MutS2 [Sporohalobacter salinus]